MSSTRALRGNSPEEGSNEEKGKSSTSNDPSPFNHSPQNNHHHRTALKRKQDRRAQFPPTTATELEVAIHQHPRSRDARFDTFSSSTESTRWQTAIWNSGPSADDPPSASSPSAPRLLRPECGYCGWYLVLFRKAMIWHCLHDRCPTNTHFSEVPVCPQCECGEEVRRTVEGWRCSQEVCGRFK